VIETVVNFKSILGGVVAQWLERQTMDTRVPGSNPGISQGWDYWQSPVTLLLGGQNKGLLRKTASTTLMGFVWRPALLQAGG
jgi:hypothetical protein